MSRQLFNPGDTVKIANSLPPSMAHFPHGGLAVIKGSYGQLCGDGGVETEGSHQYGVVLGDLSNMVSWYPEDLLTLVRPGTYEYLMEVIEGYRRAALERNQHEKESR